MERSLRARLGLADDIGMSIVEVLIASVILLIALTAMLALLLTSTGLSARARAESLAVTTASRFIETVRQTTYKSLDQAKLNALATAASGSVGGMTVSITASMTAHPISDEPSAYQEVRVLVSVTGPGFKRFEFRTGTFVREWRYSGSDTQTDPTVDFDSQTPVAGATARPIWGTNVHVGATAHSNMTDVVLTQVNVVWRVPGYPASYLATATPGTSLGSCSTLWDTTAVPEGRKGTMHAECWDALNQPDSKTRDFIIDNRLPDAPTGVTLASTVGNSQLTWEWPLAMDGETAVSSYEPTVYQLLPQAAMSSYNSWVPAVQPPVSTTTYAFASAPFSLYHPAIVSIGPREVAGLGTWRSDATPPGSDVLTRPGFSTMSVGVTKDKNADPLRFTAHTLELTPPTFKVTTSSYRWEYRVGSGAWTAFPSGTSPNTNPSAGAVVHFAQVTGPDKSQPTLSFRCTASVTRPNGTSYTNKSAIMTVAEPWTGQTYTLASFTPDWTTSW